MLREYDTIHMKKIQELRKIKEENQKLRTNLANAKRKYENAKVYPEPSALAKLFKTKTYKRYEESIKEKQLLKEEYEQLENLSSNLESGEQIDYEIKEVEQRRLDGRIKFQVIIEYFNNNNIPLVLTEEDKNYFISKVKASNNPNNSNSEKRRIEKLEDVMLIHKTNYSPKSDTIGSRMSTGVIDESQIEILGEKYNINLRPYRNTVHFAANHEVATNIGGNWKNCRYAIIVPILSIPKEQFGSNNCVDTFTEGPVKLDNQCYIICPKEEIGNVKKNNPNAIVIGYEGQSALDYANALLWALGYPVEEGNDWGFENSKHQIYYTQLMKEKGYSNLTHHTHTDTKKIEDKRFYASKIIGILELIMNNSNLQTIDSKKLVEETKIAEYLYWCDNDTRELFNYYLSEIGLEPNYANQGIEEQEAIKYCISLIDSVKAISQNKPKSYK